MDYKLGLFSLNLAVHPVSRPPPCSHPFWQENVCTLLSVVRTLSPRCSCLYEQPLIEVFVIQPKRRGDYFCPRNEQSFPCLSTHIGTQEECRWTKCTPGNEERNRSKKRAEEGVTITGLMCNNEHGCLSNGPDGSLPAASLTHASFFHEPRNSFITTSNSRHLW